MNRHKAELIITEKQIPKRPEYPVFRTISTRWMDVDSYGHVNNVEYLSYFDTAVNGWYLENGLIDMISGEKIFLVVETSCTYLGEIIFPDIIHAGIKIERIGNSSVTYSIALFRNNDNTACALGRFVHVLVNRKSRKPTPIEDKHLKLFQEAYNQQRQSKDDASIKF